MNGNYLDKLLSLNAKHALYREDGKWYHHIREFPGVLFDKSGYILFNNEEEYYRNQDFKGIKELYIKNGIKSLEGYKVFTPDQIKLIYKINIDSMNNKNIDEEIIRISREVATILRKKSLIIKLKTIYNNTCQICGIMLSAGNNKFYSEVHHIIPLGHPHNGKDNLGNMICVCPNHHAQLDLLAIPLEIESFKIIRHSISSASLEHHNLLFSRNLK